MPSACRRRGSLSGVVAVAAVVAAYSTLTAQSPLPNAGQRGQGPAPAQQGQAALPQAPIVSPVASISAPVTGPGQPFSSLMSLPAGGDMPSTHAVSAEEQALLWREVGQRPERHREVLVLYDREERSVASVAS